MGLSTSKIANAGILKRFSLDGVFVHTTTVIASSELTAQANDYWNTGCAVVLWDQSADVAMVRDIIDFDSATGKLTIDALPATFVPINGDVGYIVPSSASVSAATLALILADVGDFSANTNLQSLRAVIGNILDTDNVSLARLLMSGALVYSVAAAPAPTATEFYIEAAAGAGISINKYSKELFMQKPFVVLSGASVGRLGVIQNYSTVSGWLSYTHGDTAFTLAAGARICILVGSTTFIGLSSGAATDLDGSIELSLFGGLRNIRNRLVTIDDIVDSLLLRAPATATYGDGNDVSINLGQNSIYNAVAGTVAAVNRRAGAPQVFVKTLNVDTATAVHNLATVTTAPVVIDYLVLHADTAAPANFTSGAIVGGVTGSDAVTFLTAAQTANAILAAADKQAEWVGAIRLAVTATRVIEMKLVGVTAQTTDFTVTIGYHAETDGGYLA